MKRCRFVLCLCAMCCAAWATTASAQSVPAKPQVMSDEDLLRVFPPPQEIIIWGLGVHGSMKGSVNTRFSPKTDVSSTPALNDDQSFLAINPAWEAGVTLFAPILFGAFGMNLEASYANYSFGTQYRTKAFTAEADKTRLGLTGNAERPTFTTNLTYLTFSPMLNISGLLIGADIGVPLFPGSLQYPTVTGPLGLTGQTRTIATNELATFVQARIGGMLKLFDLPSSTIYLTLNGRYMITSPMQNDNLTNEIVRDAYKAATAPIIAPLDGNRPRELDPINVNLFSLSAGLSFIFNFTNSAIINEFKHEQKIVDSLRIEDARYRYKADSIKSLSVKLAEQAIDAVSGTMKLTEQLNALEKRRKDSLLAVEKRRVEEGKKQLAETKKKVFQALITSVVGVDEKGAEVPLNLRVEQFQSTRLFALLRRVYFDAGSETIPSRYKTLRPTEADGYKLPTSAETSPVEVYRTLLNIVGKRMAQNPNAKLTLTGFADAEEAKKSPALAQQRADAVSAYLRTVWRVSDKRIEKRTLPANDANADERHSVELSSSSPELFQPFTVDFVSRVASPPVLKCNLDISTGTGLKQWSMEIQQIANNESVSLKDTSGGSTAPAAWLWYLNEQPASIPVSSEPLSLRVGAYDVNNTQSPDAPVVSVPVQQVTIEQKRKAKQPDKTIAVHDVLMNSTSQVYDEQAVKSVRTAITAQSALAVSGAAADAVVKALGASTVQRKPTMFSIKNPQTPEERVYANVVRVEIATPLK